MDGVRGSIDFTQRSPFDPTWTNFQLGASDGDYESNLRFVSSVLQYSVQELPPRVVGDDVENMCNTTGGIYNPSGLDLKKLPPLGEILTWMKVTAMRIFNFYTDPYSCSYLYLYN